MSDHPSCIDISHWQGFPDFETVADQGVVACIMKATEGTGYIDPNRAINFINATAAGIACCTYHWIKPGNATAQMRFYLDTVDPVPGERMVIDYEEDGCTLDDLKEAVAVLIADPRDLQITVYSGHLLKEQLNGGHDAFLAENTDLWLAQYTSGNPSWSTGTYEHWTLWQYSESGVVAGIEDTNVDLNRFDGSDAELVKWISPAGTPARRPRPEPGETVSADIVSPESVAVRLTANGDEVARRRMRSPRVRIPRVPDIK
jgi:lysozyme